MIWELFRVRCSLFSRKENGERKGGEGAVCSSERPSPTAKSPMESPGTGVRAKRKKEDVYDVDDADAAAWKRKKRRVGREPLLCAGRSQWDQSVVRCPRNLSLTQQISDLDL